MKCGLSAALRSVSIGVAVALEGEEILLGTNFGIVTDIQTGPDGALYLVGPVPPGEIRKISRP